MQQVLPKGGQLQTVAAHSLISYTTTASSFFRILFSPHFQFIFQSPLSLSLSLSLPLTRRCDRSFSNSLMYGYDDDEQQVLLLLSHPMLTCG